MQGYQKKVIKDYLLNKLKWTIPEKKASR